VESSNRFKLLVVESADQKVRCWNSTAKAIFNNTDISNMIKNSPEPKGGFVG
jgi:hypothetical protein